MPFFLFISMTDKLAIRWIEKVEGKGNEKKNIKRKSKGAVATRLKRYGDVFTLARTIDEFELRRYAFLWLSFIHLTPSSTNGEPILRRQNVYLRLSLFNLVEARLPFQRCHEACSRKWSALGCPNGNVARHSTSPRSLSLFRSNASRFPTLSALLGITRPRRAASWSHTRHSQRR